jgi:hypothetical protein
LPNTFTITNWVNRYKNKLEKGAVALNPVEKPKTKDTADLKKRIKDLEKANALIYGLNLIIDTVVKTRKGSVRKKVGA